MAPPAATIRRLAALLGIVAVIGGACGGGGPSPGSTTPGSISSGPTPLAGPAGLFPSAAFVGDVMGLHLEAAGVDEDLGQMWEGIEIAPDDLVAGNLQVYREPAAAGGTDGSIAGAFVDIAEFRTAALGSAYGDAMAATATGRPFAPALAADRVTASSWTSSEGFGGSTVIVQDGPFVSTVTVFRTGATALEDEAEQIAADVLGRLGP